MGGGITAQQRGGLVLRARRPQAIQQPGHGARVVEEDVGSGPAERAVVSAEVGRRSAQVENSAVVAAGGGVLVELGGVTVQAASVGGLTQRGLVAGEGVACRHGPEAHRGDLALAVASAVLIEVIREPVHRHPRDAAWPPASCSSLSPEPGLAARDLPGRGRMGVSGPRTPLQGTAT